MSKRCEECKFHGEKCERTQPSDESACIGFSRKEEPKMKEIKLTLSEQEACAMITAVTALLNDEKAPYSACVTASKVANGICSELIAASNPLIPLMAAMVMDEIDKYAEKHKGGRGDFFGKS